MKTGKRTGRLLAAGLALMMLCSCGYQLVGGKGIYGGDITSLSLGAFKNVTYEPHVSLYVTDAFSQELLSTGLFSLNTPGADAQLEGTIKRIIIQPAAMNAQGVVVQKTAWADVELALYKKDGSFIKRWQFSDSEPYRVDDVQAEDYNKRNALQIIAGRMARKFCAAILVDY
jgi:hypothetical protein